MGAVFEVEHVITRHRRALKLLHRQMADVPGVVERFLREASAAGRIGNPHIVETFDAGRLESGEPYIVMELLRGKSLAEKLQESGPLDVATACEVLIQACDGVGAAHAAGIIHRDLKPDNLFLVGPDCSYVKILDFGISKFDSAITGVEGFTIEGSPLGTPFYMSPEQVRGQKTVDVGTDVYALGVVLYECLTNQRPYDADTLPHLIYLISQGQYTLPSLLRPSLPRALDAIVSKALALVPAERYASAQELALALAKLRQSLAPPSLEAELPVSIPPQVDPVRVAPALTPGVFSSSALRQGEFPPPPKSRRRLYWAVGGVALCLLGVGLTIGWLRPNPSLGARLEPSSSSDSAGVVDTSGKLSGSGRVAEPAQPVVSPVLATAVPTGATANLAPARESAKAAGSSLPNAPTQRAPKLDNSTKAPSRASSVGLSQDNPFK